MQNVLTNLDGFDQITAWVPDRARVLDLGCGDGELLDALRTKKQTRGYGLDIADSAILACAKRGINAIQGNLERGLTEFADQSFDVVILSRTLQATHRTAELVDDMLRVGKSAIVTLPNFGHWQVRWKLGVGGRMPVSDNLPYQWYDTPNVHFATVLDFDAFCRERELFVEERAILAKGQPVHFAQNLRGDLGVFKITKRR